MCYARQRFSQGLVIWVALLDVLELAESQRRYFGIHANAFHICLSYRSCRRLWFVNGYVVASVVKVSMMMMKAVPVRKMVDKSVKIVDSDVGAALACVVGPLLVEAQVLGSNGRHTFYTENEVALLNCIFGVLNHFTSRQKKIRKRQI